jgi:hypothetical protein
MRFGVDLDIIFPSDSRYAKTTMTSLQMYEPVSNYGPQQEVADDVVARFVTEQV